MGLDNPVTDADSSGMTVAVNRILHTEFYTLFA
jgi:hypothetical protein